MSIVEKAKKLATEGHFGVFRKWSNPPVPYICHCERVAEKVASLSGTTEVDIAAAWDHDLVEDVDMPNNNNDYAIQIEKECGADVLALVLELTFETEGAAWRNRSRDEKNVIREAHMRKMTLRAQRIKLVDRWDNVGDMRYAPRKLIHKTVDESYRLADICGQADPEMANELRQRIKELEKNRR